MSQYSHILWAVIHTKMCGIFIHDHIKLPMQLILNMPMRAYPLCEFLHLSRTTTDKIARFSFNLCSDLALAFYHTDTLEIAPVCDGRELGKSIRKPIAPCLDTSMAFFNRFIRQQTRISAYL